MTKIAFVCVHNSCRSQMAEAWALSLNEGRFEIHSAGTEVYHQVKPLAVKVMEEVGISMEKHYPKLLDDIPEELDILITMGCGVACPFVANSYQEDWGLEDPSGGPIEGFRETRDIIKDKVSDLFERIENGEILESK